MRVGGSIEIVPVLVAIGVTEAGQKLVLSFQAGDKESATSWREFFKDLKSRGLDGGKVTLGIMDGLSGLESVFKSFRGRRSSAASSMWPVMSWPRCRRSSSRKLNI